MKYGDHDTDDLKLTQLHWETIQHKVRCAFGQYVGKSEDETGVSKEVIDKLNKFINNPAFMFDLIDTVKYTTIDYEVYRIKIKEMFLKYGLWISEKGLDSMSESLFLIGMAVNMIAMGCPIDPETYTIRMQLPDQTEE